MSRNDNYPDNIRDFDDVPGSPFYVDPNEWMEQAATDLAWEWAEELEKTGIIEFNGYEKADIAALMEETEQPDFDEALYQLAHDTIEKYPEDYRPEPMPREDWE